MDKKDPFTATVLAPTATRPLLGLTILVIEDSRFACEALRLLCLRSGARIRRADCLRSAKRHLRVYRPSVVIADLGLPDGNGADLIRELVAGDPRVEVVLGMSGDSNGKETAMKAGADLETGVFTLGLAEEGVGYAMDENNASLVSADMQAAVDAAREKIISGELEVASYYTNDSCPALEF